MLIMAVSEDYAMQLEKYNSEMRSAIKNKNTVCFVKQYKCMFLCSTYLELQCGSRQSGYSFVP